MSSSKRNYCLKLPSSYIEIDKDEMEYVDGGGTDIAMSCKSFAALVNTAIGLAIGGAAAGGVAAYIRSVGVREASKIFSATIITKMKAAGLISLASFVVPAVNYAINFLDIGTAVANFIDARDTYPNNGVVG